MANPSEDDPHVLVEVAEGVAVITLHRPDRLNAFTGRMGAELGAAYAACDLDDDVRAVVLTGAGRGFCAGADLGGSPATFGAPAADRPFTSSRVWPPAWEVRKPVIAAINGPALGIGLTIPMQCDLRLVADDATLGFVHVRMGVLPDAHAHWTVPRAVGFAVAAGLLLTRRRFSGEEAATMGLAHRALPAADVLPAAIEVARDIAVNTAPLSVAASKQLLWARPALDADEADRLETAWHQVLMGTADALEGPASFLGERRPQWTLSPTDVWPTGL